MKNKNNDIKYSHKKRLAKIAISSSAFRNQGKPMLIEFTKNYILEKVNLDHFASSLVNDKYYSYLNKETLKLMRAAKFYHCKWGTARKGLNIFFRDVTYNSYFQKHYQFKTTSLKQLEIPLDGKTMKRIIKLSSSPKLSNLNLPETKLSTIIRLTPDSSDSFQTVAEEISKRIYTGYSRVDLDMIFWTE